MKDRCMWGLVRDMSGMCAGGVLVVGPKKVGAPSAIRRQWRIELGKAFCLAAGFALVCLAVALGSASEALAQREKTPIAHDFAGKTNDDEVVLFAVAEVLSGGGEGLRVGFAVLCERASRNLEAFMSFGSVPLGKPVQAAVRTSDGRVERFGPVVRGGGPAAGFFDPKVVERADVLRLVDAAFTTGALVSNGHNSVWNRIGADENRAAREELRRCAGAVE